MTFVQGFYSFSIELTHSDRNFSDRLRFKIPRHPLEPAEYLLARVIAFAHSYEEGLQFSRGFFEPKEPTIWKHTAIGEPEVLIEVGDLDADRLSRSLRRYETARHSVYFYSDSQIDQFCHGMRGSKTNWIEPAAFFKIESTLLDPLLEIIPSSSNWEMTIVDSHVYLVANGVGCDGGIEKLDMWPRFQQTLKAS